MFGALRVCDYCLLLPLLENEEFVGCLFLGFSGKNTISTQELDFYELFAMLSTAMIQQIATQSATEESSVVLLREI